MVKDEIQQEVNTFNQYLNMRKTVVSNVKAMEDKDSSKVGEFTKSLTVFNRVKKNITIEDFEQENFPLKSLRKESVEIEHGLV